MAPLRKWRTKAKVEPCYVIREAIPGYVAEPVKATVLPAGRYLGATSENWLQKIIRQDEEWQERKVRVVRYLRWLENQPPTVQERHGIRPHSGSNRYSFRD